MTPHAQWQRYTPSPNRSHAKFTESGLTQGQRLSLPILIEHLGRRRGGE
jgi:hypothetical protein